MKRQGSGRLIGSIWLQGTLLALAALVWWWLKRRGERLPARRPAVWRRDVEMGPTRTAQPADIILSDAADSSIPEMEAGDGGPIEAAERAEGGDPAGISNRAPEVIAPAEEPAAETPSGDDLEIIEGIGPKITLILQQAGVRTFAQLAETEISALEKILRGVGLRFANPATWPEQARLAAQGEWSKLETLKATLKAGRRA